MFRYLAVGAVCREPVSALFPVTGKITGKVSAFSRRFLCARGLAQGTARLAAPPAASCLQKNRELFCRNRELEGALQGRGCTPELRKPEFTSASRLSGTINNAQRAQELRNEFGSLAAYFWRFEPATDTRPHQITRQSMSGITTSPESIALSKDLRKRGWSFVGPTTMYAFMQAMGLVNDHIQGCSARTKALQARSDFKSPVVETVR